MPAAKRRAGRSPKNKIDCFDDEGEGTASEEHIVLADMVEEHTKKRSRAQRNSITPPRQAFVPHGGAQVEADAFAAFASKYRDVLQFADADEAEAVYSMVSLTQAPRAGGWLKPERPDKAEVLPASRPVKRQQVAAPQPAASACSEGGRSDSSAKSAPSPPSAQQQHAQHPPLQQQQQSTLHVGLGCPAGMMLPPGMPSPAAATAGAAVGSLCCPPGSMVPPGFGMPFPPMMGCPMPPFMPPFMPPWAMPGMMPFPHMFPHMMGPPGAMPLGGLPHHAAARLPGGAAAGEPASGVPSVLPMPGLPVSAMVPSFFPGAAGAAMSKPPQAKQQQQQPWAQAQQQLAQQQQAQQQLAQQQLAQQQQQQLAKQQQQQQQLAKLQMQQQHSKQQAPLPKLQLPPVAPQAAAPGAPAPAPAAGVASPAATAMARDAGSAAASPRASPASPPVASPAGPGSCASPADIHPELEQLDLPALKPWVLAHFCEDVYLLLLDVWRPGSPLARDAVWAWRSHVAGPVRAGGAPDYRAFLVSLFGLEKLLQLTAADHAGRSSSGLAAVPAPAAVLCRVTPPGPGDAAGACAGAASGADHSGTGSGTASTVAAGAHLLASLGPGASSGAAPGGPTLAAAATLPHQAGWQVAPAHA